MTQETSCAEALRGFIERADRDELGAAQGAILRYALSFPDTAQMSASMSGLLATLKGDPRLDRLQPLQAAFQTVIDAMIARTEAELAARAQAS